MKTLQSLNPTEFRAFVDALKTLTPPHTFWRSDTGHIGTWSTSTGLWAIEVHHGTGRTVIRQGDENRWTNFFEDIAWHRNMLEHLGALE